MTGNLSSWKYDWSDWSVHESPFAIDWASPLVARPLTGGTLTCAGQPGQHGTKENGMDNIRQTEEYREKLTLMHSTLGALLDDISNHVGEEMEFVRVHLTEGVVCAYEFDMAVRLLESVVATLRTESVVGVR